MAACIPTLPPGYRWLRKRLSKSKQNNSKTHLLPFAENPANLGFLHEASPSKPPRAPHHHHVEDHDISNALRSSFESGPPRARAALAFSIPNRIQRTIRVDVDVDIDVERDAVDDDNTSKKKKKKEVEVEEGGKGKKPCIEIDLGPRFEIEIEIESLRRGFGGSGMLLDAGAGAGAGAEGGRSRQGSGSGSEDTLVE